MTSRGQVKRKLVTGVAKYAINPVVRGMFSLGIPAPGTAVLETTGRKSGRPHHTPVTNGLQDGEFWIVAEHGRRAGYVRNLEANPRVRVRVDGRWYEGTAHVVPEDDPLERLWRLGAGRPAVRLSTLAVRVMQTDLLSVRIDLDED